MSRGPAGRAEDVNSVGEGILTDKSWLVRADVVSGRGVVPLRLAKRIVRLLTPLVDGVLWETVRLCKDCGLGTTTGFLRGESG